MPFSLEPLPVDEVLEVRRSKVATLDAQTLHTSSQRNVTLNPFTSDTLMQVDVFQLGKSSTSAQALHPRTEPGCPTGEALLQRLSCSLR
ncbi:hypothetical protein AURDEDRAFT_176955 [Auricularia subglabra TFB-10046 SS5]|uniref:Uncharacterized protein n=1 Tax=Auricularia subglabra (strain TFB-10046 / SS5) TaxID=717982 RepID=J0WNN7_AURST|nr:hypothetical protein AURDEDRAFT_176955 [Auricularia subglabra TFB-10046 SS5]